MIKLKDIPESVEEINYNVRDLTIEDIVPNVIDNFLVTIFDGHQTLVLPPTTTSLQLSIWMREKGGVFSKDVLKYALGHKCGQYVHINGNDLNCIARLITEEEEFSFNTLKLIDGKIKDVPYMVLRHLKEDDTLTKTQKIILDKDVYTEIDTIILTSSVTTTHEEETDYHSNSISLFSEE